MTIGRIWVCALVLLGGAAGSQPAVCLLPNRGAAAFLARDSGKTVFAQAAQTPPPVTLEQLNAAIDQLGNLDYQIRTKAAQTVRRAPGTLQVPALTQAVLEHSDGYVRYRALTLLSGLDDPRVPDTMLAVMADPNDRLREVTYAYLERHPDPRQIPALVAALNKETAEFVRPSLIRALAALGKDPGVQKVLLSEVQRGQDFFRSAVIEALGDSKSTYAVPALMAIVKLDGPLQDDAAIALGKIGDRQALNTLAGIQRTAPREAQPAIAAGICLMGQNCESHRGFLVKTLSFAEDTPGFQELLRAAAAGLGAIATTGDAAASQALFDVGIPSHDPARAPIALASAGFAVRNTPSLLSALEGYPDRAGAVLLLAEGFDMLEEDFAEEQFFVAVRKTYWAAAENTQARAVTQALIQKLEF
jgi:HEAT repeat protein